MSSLLENKKHSGQTDQNSSRLIFQRHKTSHKTSHEAFKSSLQSSDNKYPLVNFSYQNNEESAGNRSLRTQQSLGTSMM